MAKTKPTSTGRVFFTKGDTGLPLPNLIAHQKDSWRDFVETGLSEIFSELNPIDDYTGQKLALRFKEYRFQDLGFRVFRNDAIDVAGIRARRPDGLVLSPGPCPPDQAGVTLEAIRALADIRSRSGDRAGFAEMLVAEARLAGAGGIEGGVDHLLHRHAIGEQSDLFQQYPSLSSEGLVQTV